MKGDKVIHDVDGFRVRTQAAVNFRKAIDRMVVLVTCHGCKKVVVTIPQRQVNTAPSMSNTLMSQAVKRHAHECEKYDGQVSIDRAERVS